MLIIDDEVMMLNSCGIIFEAEGFEVTTTEDAEEGLNMASEKEFDVILCDWKMPGFDGLEVLAELQNRTPESTIVMFSGYPSIDRASEAIRRGAMDYIPKPFTSKEIIKVVQKAIRRKMDEEKKSLSRFKTLMSSFPGTRMEDKGPKTIAETVAQSVGVVKANSPWLSLFVLGILAGAYVGFGGLLSTAVTFDAASRLGMGLTKLLGGAAFSLGLMLVVIAGGELFTSNSLMFSSVIIGEVTWEKMLAKWGIVYLANFVGSILLALIFYYSGLWRTADGALGTAALKIGYDKLNLSFVEAFVRGVGCNWLVCLAVWMSLASRQIIGKIFAIFFPIMGFVAIGFEHCVANIYFISSAIFLFQWGGIASPAVLDPNLLSWGTLLLKNLLPVTIGNAIGGVVFVALSYWGAYLRPEREVVSAPAKMHAQ